MNATVRRNRGTDIDAACGQLAARAAPSRHGGPAGGALARPPAVSGTGPLRRAVDAFVVAVAPGPHPPGRGVPHPRRRQAPGRRGAGGVQPHRRLRRRRRPPHRRRARRLHRRLRPPVRHRGPGRQPQRHAGRRACSPAAGRSSTPRRRCSTSWCRPTAATAATGRGRYYRAALDIGHTVLALDAFPAHAELSAVERFRSALLPAHGRGRRPPTGRTPPDRRPPRPARRPAPPAGRAGGRPGRRPAGPAPAHRGAAGRARRAGRAWRR